MCLLVRWARVLGCVGCGLGLVSACDSRESARPERSPQVAASAGRPVSAAPPRMVPSPADGDVAAWVKTQRAQAASQGERVVVYVGAEWCEPCQVFKDSLKAGDLNTELPGVRFLEFDLDHQGEALAAAGYRSRMIPLFAVPDQEGRGGEQRIEGSIKGPGATAEILPRLQRMLTAP